MPFSLPTLRVFDDLPRDLRLAMRLLVKDRWFTAAATFALSLGIAANTTVYTVVNTMMLRGLPVAHPDRFVAFDDPTHGPLAVSYRDVEDWRASTTRFAGLAAYTQASMTVDDAGRAPEQFGGAYISGNGFQLLEEQPQLGRILQPQDDRRGAPAVVVLGYRVWKSRYDSDPAIVGRPIRVNGAPAVVVGVMREGFRFPLLEDIWQPLAAMAGLATDRREARTLRVFGRLADGVSIGGARAEINSIAQQLAREHPDTNSGARVLVDPFTGTPRHPVYLALFGAVAFVLLIACANVAHLLVARTTRRWREISIRISLGATRWRIVRQLLVETLIVAAVAGVLGLLLSVAGVRAYAYAVNDINFPYWYDHRWTMDRHVFAFVAVICLGSAIVSGLLPAWQLSKPRVNDTLKEVGRGAVGAGGARRWTSALLVAQLAFTLVLLTGAALMMRSFVAVYRADEIVDASPIMTYSLRPPAVRYRTAALRMAFFERLLQRLDGTPAVQSASITNAWPFGYTPQWRAAIDDGSPTDEHVAFTASYVTAGPRYFETLGVTVVRGRDFDELDGSSGHDAAIVNQLLAARWFGGDDPIGRRIAFVDPGLRAAKPYVATIVGISPTVRQTVLEDLSPVIYAPLRANPPAVGRLLVRGRAGTAPLTALVRDQLRAIDAELPLANPIPLDYMKSGSRWGHRVFGAMLAIFALIAILLAAIGLYATTAYAVTQRQQEIGVRVALGARVPQVLWLFVRGALAQLAAAVMIGLGGAYGVGTLLSGMLIQTPAHDPATLAALAVLLAAVVLAATVLPSRRAARIDPAIALRYE